jgi:hypothetical protein
LAENSDKSLTRPEEFAHLFNVEIEPLKPIADYLRIHYTTPSKVIGKTAVRKIGF